MFFALKYMTRFQCIADRCEDTCCAGMQITVNDADTQRLEAAVGAEEVAEKVLPLETPVHGCSSVLARTSEAACRFLDSRQLCSVVIRAGDAAVPDACATFPRTVVQTAERVELVGTLACPEAARLCLLPDDGLELVESSPALMSRITRKTPSNEPYDALNEVVRDATIEMLRDHSVPIRTRLLRIAELAARSEHFFFRGSDAPNAREQLLHAVAQPSTDAHESERGELVVQMVFSLLSGLRGRGTERFNQLLNAATYTFQVAALEREPSLGTSPQPSLMWSALAAVFHEKSDRAERMFGSRLSLLLERYWINDVYREPYTRAPTLSTHVFRMLLRGVVLRFLILGHPAFAALDAVDTDEQMRVFEAAVIQSVQLYAKHIERDVDMFVMLEKHFSLEMLGTDSLGRARIFAAFT